MTTADEVWALLRAQVSPRPAAAVPLAEASGRTLRETVFTREDMPPFDRSAVDGFAGRFNSYSRRVCGSGASGADSSARSPASTRASCAASLNRALPHARARGATMFVALAPSSGPMLTTVPARRSTKFDASRMRAASALTALTPCAKSRPACAALPMHSRRNVALPNRSTTTEPSGSAGSIANPSPPRAACSRATARIARPL